MVAGSLAGGDLSVDSVIGAMPSAVGFGESIAGESSWLPMGRSSCGGGNTCMKTIRLGEDSLSALRKPN
jgi:hypothetical protein